MSRHGISVCQPEIPVRDKKNTNAEMGFNEKSGIALVSFAAVFWDVTQRSPKETAAHIQTTFLSRN